MVTLSEQPKVEGDPVEREASTVPGRKVLAALRAAAVVFSLLSIAVPIAVMVLGDVRHYEEWHYVDGVWRSDTWPLYVGAGFALSLVLGLVGIGLARWWLRSWLTPSIVAFVVALLANLLMWGQSILFGVSM